MHIRWMGVLIVLVSFASFANANVKLPAVISDHMVLQRGQQIPIWGWADKGEKITVKAAGQEQSTSADDQGNWRVNLAPLDAVGTIDVTVTGKNSIKISDVLIGDVWVCSGQSNMEFQTRTAMNGDEEVAKANDPQLRFFHVGPAAFEQPQKDVKGKWELCTPKTVATFSAVGYFFGRNLREQLKAPIGLIESDWGGTPAESWTDHQTLASDPAFAPILARHEKDVAAYPGKRKTYDIAIHNWKDKVETKDPGNKGVEQGWAKSDFDDSNWKTMPVPGAWEKSAHLNIDGAVWFRKEVDVPADWAGKDLELTLGKIDDSDITYFNGEQIGDTGGDLAIFVHRDYHVPGKLVKAGKNVIAVRVFDYRAEGGFVGTPGELKLAPADATSSTKPISLAGDWRYAVEYEASPKPNLPKPSEPPHANWAWAPSNLYNGMINPVVPFAIKGAIWYQGESNADNAEHAAQYEHLLSSMITGWRRAWGEGDFPFLIVQLANWRAPATQPVQEKSTWAPLREAQATVAEKVPNTGLATAVDIGDAVTIHPTNKQEVGRRLALVALKIAYGQSVVFSGPTYHSMSTEGNKIILSFDNIGSGLVAKNGAKLKGFAIAGKDKVWHTADATIDGSTVVVSSKDVPDPVAVRYDWADNPDGNLYNKEGLPAIPFRTDG
jgi:sialate O-acetylesterase